MAYTIAERTLKKLYDLKITIQNLEEELNHKQREYTALRENIRSTAQEIGKKKKELLEKIEL